MRRVTKSGMVMLILISLAILIMPVAANWHGGKALVLYKKGGDGWVEWNYKESDTWKKFRNEFAEQGWTVEFAKHVNDSLLSNYDALFVLTPVKDIPDDEAQAIIDWVKSGGQLVITQNGTGTYANEITAEFGIEFDGCRPMEINKFASHPVTTTPNLLNKVDGATARKIKVFGSSKKIGWYEGKKVKYCLLAVNDTAGKGVVVAIGDEWMWSYTWPSYRFDKDDNKELLDNILAYFRQTCSIPEYPSPLLPLLLIFGAVFLLLRRNS